MSHSPVTPLSPREAEEAIRDRIAASFFGGWTEHDRETGEPIGKSPYIPGVTFEDVTLDGEFPRTELVATFRSAERPGRVFGRRWQLWGEGADDASLLDVELLDDVREGVLARADAPAGQVAWV